MPLGIISDDEFLAETQTIKEKLDSESHAVPSDVVPSSGSIIDIIPKGRKDGDNNVPDSLRQIIGEEAVINGRQAAVGLAGMFGISPSSVSAYAKGATSTASYDTPVKSIISHINKSRRRAIKRASLTLNKSLEAITQEKLDYTDAKDLSVIAKNMSAVIKDLEPPQQSSMSEANGPQFVIFAPQFRSENSYEVIDVKE